MKWTRFLGLLIMAGCLCNCTYSVHMVAFSEDVPPSKKPTAKLIEAKTSQFVILGFVGDTNYVEDAYAKLQSQCSGNIGAIATKFYTDHGFFSWTNHIELDGYCYN